ncbi:MAG: LCP family protein [Chloroflexi bacterium]|nr:LCP family protein [Chloroflexota bacterium]
MQDPFDIPPPPPPDHGAGFSLRQAALTCAVTTFILGGFWFGWLFLSNWKLLLQFQTTQVRIPGGSSITLPARPDVVVVPQPRPPGPAPTTAPGIEIPRETELPAWSGSSRVNILLLGIDHRDDEPVDGSRSDTIMVVSIDPVTKAVVMVSFPRDLWVSIPGHPNQRINAAHVFGGPALVSRAMEANFGIRIHHFARIGFRGFEQIVDALGGVIVDVERMIKDDEYPTEDYGVMRLIIPPGPQLMDGRLALQYSRSRHSENDFGRARRQQRLLLAMRERGLQLNILPKVPSLIGLVQKAIQTDVGVTDMLALARLGSDVERDRVKSIVIDAELADPFIGPTGEDLLSPRRADIQRAIARAFAEASGQAARIEVLNGTNRPGIARQLADQLANAGYEIVWVDAADRTDYRESSLVVFNGSQAAATTLAARLRIPPGAIHVSSQTNNPADVRIILGQNYQP